MTRGGSGERGAAEVGGRGLLAGRRILFLPRYTRSGPSSRLRMLQFIPAFEEAGARVEVAPFFDEQYLASLFGAGRKDPRHILRAFRHRFGALRTLRRFDALWIEKEAFPFLPGPLEALIRRANRPYVVDYDDAIFHNYDLSPRWAVRRFLSNKLDPLLRGAAEVTAGNSYLADYATRHDAPSTVLIPTVVDPDRYLVSAAARPADDPALRVGWIGTPRNAHYLAPVVAALNRLGERVPVRLVTIGAPAVPGLSVPQEAHAWSEETETALLAMIDVGVMPLIDEPFERGKCGYKLIQYLAAGKPVVASPVGVNPAIVSPDVGVLADDVDAWTDALSRLAADRTLREAMGAAGRLKVEREYSVRAVAPKIVACFARVLAGH